MSNALRNTPEELEHIKKAFCEGLGMAPEQIVHQQDSFFTLFQKKLAESKLSGGKFIRIVAARHTNISESRITKMIIEANAYNGTNTIYTTKLEPEVMRTCGEILGAIIQARAFPLDGQEAKNVLFEAVGMNVESYRTIHKSHIDLNAGANAINQPNIFNIARTYMHANGITRSDMEKYVTPLIAADPENTSSLVGFSAREGVDTLLLGGPAAFMKMVFTEGFLRALGRAMIKVGDVKRACGNLDELVTEEMRSVATTQVTIAVSDTGAEKPLAPKLTLGTYTIELFEPASDPHPEQRRKHARIVGVKIVQEDGEEVLFHVPLRKNQEPEKLLRDVYVKLTQEKHIQESMRSTLTLGVIEKAMRDFSTPTSNKFDVFNPRRVHGI